MKSFFAGGIIAALATVSLTDNLPAQRLDSPSLLPIPSVHSNYPTTQQPQYRVGRTLWYQEKSQELPPGPAAKSSPMDPAPMPAATSPSDVLPPGKASMPSHAMPSSQYLPSSGTPSPSSCASGNCGQATCDGGGYYYGEALGVSQNRPASCWFASAGGLLMNRDRGNQVWLSFDTSAPGNVLLGSRDAEMDWAGGFDMRIGRYFDHGQSGWEVVYFGVFPNVSEANAFDPNGAVGGPDLNTTFAFQSLNYQGNPIVGWFDNAMRHRLRRSYEFHNIEWNLFGTAVANPCSRWQFGWNAGLRYFKFKDGFSFASDDQDTVFTGGVDEVYYNVDVQNHLIGFQLGGQVNYQAGCRFGLRASAKMGVFANHMKHTSFVGGAAGAAVINDVTNPDNGQPLDVSTNKDDIAMLGELSLGGNYRISSCWSANFGYRAVAISGVGLSTNQIPANFGDLHGVQDIDSNGSLILHGAYGGLEFNY